MNLKMDNITLLNFVDLSLKEKIMILNWRNNPTVKNWMYTLEEISLENHLNFISNLEYNSEKKYFLLKENEENIGVIDFTKITDESLHMGLYSNPNVKKKGRVLLEIIIAYSFDYLKVKRILAEVFKDNEKAYALYDAFGFIPFDTKIVNQKNIICMELIKKED